MIYRWFKRVLLLAWFIATCLFTIDANEVEGIQNNIAADIVAAILLFNLTPWLISYSRWKRRKRRQEKALAEAKDEVAGDYAPAGDYAYKQRSNLRFAISLIVFLLVIGGIYQWSNEQIAILNESPTPTYLDEFEKGAADPKLAWSQVAKRNKAPLTWHTCDKIKVLVNPGDVKSAVADVKEVIEDINQLTSLNFYYAGFTTKKPFVDTPNINEVIIGFYSEEQADERFKFKDAIGLGGGRSVEGQIKYGDIGIRTPAYQKANKSIRKEVLLHEFGHVLGLDHVSKKNDLMYTNADGKQIRFNKETIEYFKAHPGCEKKVG